MNLIIFIESIKKINQFKPDIIHVQGCYLPELFILLFLKFLRDYRLITTFHDAKAHIGSEYLLHRLTREWFLKKSDGIFVHGKQQKDILIKEHGINENKVHVIPMGEHNVNPFKRYIRIEPYPDKNIVLFFGRIAFYKGIEYLVKCEPVIHREVPGAKIIIAGKESIGKLDVGYLEKCKREIINKNNFLIYDQYIDGKLGAELFQKASVVVLPYIEASQSGVIPVAYAFKKPVVVTNTGALPEIVDDGKTGFVVPTKDTGALAEAIIKLLKDEKLREEMGEAGYKKLNTDLSWDKISGITTEVYKKALEEKLNHEN
jgi:glycosyltransferase involved in cell wall biosynthesis